MGFPFGGRCQNLLSYWVCEILKKFKSMNMMRKNAVSCGRIRPKSAGRGNALSEGVSHGIIRHDKEELPCSLCADLYLQG